MRPAKGKELLPKRPYRAGLLCAVMVLETVVVGAIIQPNRMSANVSIVSNKDLTNYSCDLGNVGGDCVAISDLSYYKLIQRPADDFGGLRFLNLADHHPNSVLWADRNRGFFAALPRKMCEWLNFFRRVRRLSTFNPSNQAPSCDVPGIIHHQRDTVNQSIWRSKFDNPDVKIYRSSINGAADSFTTFKNFALNTSLRSLSVHYSGLTTHYLTLLRQNLRLASKDLVGGIRNFFLFGGNEENRACKSDDSYSGQGLYPGRCAPKQFLGWSLFALGFPFVAASFFFLLALLTQAYKPTWYNVAVVPAGIWTAYYFIGHGLNLVWYGMWISPYALE